MKHYVALGLVMGAMLLSAPAWGFPRTFVSAHGTDSGTCRPISPCRNFAMPSARPIQAAK